MTAITAAKQERKNGHLINPFYSPSFTDDGNEEYKYAQYKVRAILGTLIPAHSLSAYLSRHFLGAADRG
jgi:hypothetical protein